MGKCLSPRLPRITNNFPPQRTGNSAFVVWRFCESYARIIKHIAKRLRSRIREFTNVCALYMRAAHRDVQIQVNIYILRSCYRPTTYVYSRLARTTCVRANLSRRLGIYQLLSLNVSKDHVSHILAATSELVSGREHLLHVSTLIDQCTDRRNWLCCSSVSRIQRELDQCLQFT